MQRMSAPRDNMGFFILKTTLIFIISAIVISAANAKSYEYNFCNEAWLKLSCKNNCQNGPVCTSWTLSQCAKCNFANQPKRKQTLQNANSINNYRTTTATPDTTTTATPDTTTTPDTTSTATPDTTTTATPDTTTTATPDTTTTATPDTTTTATPDTNEPERTQITNPTSIVDAPTETDFFPFAKDTLLKIKIIKEGAKGNNKTSNKSDMEDDENSENEKDNIHRVVAYFNVGGSLFHPCSKTCGGGEQICKLREMKQIRKLIEAGKIDVSTFLPKLAKIEHNVIRAQLMKICGGAYEKSCNSHPCPTNES